MARRYVVLTSSFLVLLGTFLPVEVGWIWVRRVVFVLFVVLTVAFLRRRFPEPELRPLPAPVPMIIEIHALFWYLAAAASIMGYLPESWMEGTGAFKFSVRALAATAMAFCVAKREQAEASG